MEIDKEVFEGMLAGKLKGTFVLRNGETYFSDGLCRNYSKLKFTHPYVVGFKSYTPKGIFDMHDKGAFDIIDFIPNTNMKENESTIEIPKGKIVDWDESKKQNKIVFKDKQLTYSDICRKLFVGYGWFFTDAEGGIHHTLGGDAYSCANNSATKHQLECILAKNKLANVAKYLNGEWNIDSHSSFGYIIIDGGFTEFKIEYTAVYSIESSGRIVFKTKELAQQAIKILGEETVNLALEPLGI